MVAIDADKKRYPEHLRLCLPLLRLGQIIVSDTALRHARILDTHTHEAHLEGLRAFVHMRAQDLRLDSTALQTVGAKDW